MGGCMGTLVGADLLNLDAIQRMGAPVASIGGAGTFDGIFMTGIVAVLIASLSGPPRPVSGRCRDDDPTATVDDDPAARLDDDPAATVEDDPAARLDDDPAARLDDDPTARVDDPPAARLDDDPSRFDALAMTGIMCPPIDDETARRLERLHVRAWPAGETARLDGWLWRWSGGASQRANSVATIDFTGN